MNTPTPAAAGIPTESFYVANERIMAAVCGGQLVTDQVFGLSALHAPTKDAPTLIQSTRLLVLVDGQPVEAIDREEDGAVVERGFVPGTGAVRVVWRGAGIEVQDRYFIPPGLDVVVQESTLRNVSSDPHRIVLHGILYPQLGSPVPHKKGICRAAWYEPDDGCVLVEDTKGNTLVFAFAVPPTGYQIGEVCGDTDVYYDLEDGALSGNPRVENATPNAALSIDAGLLAPGAETRATLLLGRAADAAAARGLFAAARADLPARWADHVASSRAVLDRAAAALPADPASLDPRLSAVMERAVLVLRSILREDGAPMGGIHCYQNVGQVRNGTYILSVLDQLGFHEATRGGYEFYLNFRVGDDRYSSPDENDQLGTVLHVLRRRLDLCGDLALIRTHREKILAMADRLIGLMDASLGLIYSERAIHEYVAISRGYETYVNTMAWRGLVDAAHLTAALDETAAATRYQDAADGLRERVVRHLVDPDHGVFVKRLYRGRHYPLPAISMIAPALFGLVDAADPVVTRTIAFMKAANWDPRIGGLYRYPLHHQPWPEHPYGGPWVTYTCWLGGVYLRRGERAAAAACIRWVLDQLPADSSLIAEHFSVQHIGRRGFGRIYLDPATPEVWATAEFMRLVLAYFHGGATRGFVP